MRLFRLSIIKKKQNTNAPHLRNFVDNTRQVVDIAERFSEKKTLNLIRFKFSVNIKEIKQTELTR